MSPPLHTLGIIGGGGWLGRALASAVLQGGLVDPGSLTLSSRSVTRVDPEPTGPRWTSDNQSLVDSSDVVVVSVRPEQFDDVRVDARGRTVVSLMAGVPLRVLVDRLGTDRIVRAMPNAAAEIRRSYTPWFAAPAVPREDRSWVRSMLGCCGAVEEVSSESQIDYLTGLTGSGPAFPALLADAMIRDAVRRGFDPDLARRAVVAVVAGASQLIEGRIPSDLVDTFLDYRGITSAAIRAMLDGGFRDAVRDGLAAAEARAAGMMSG